MTSETIPNRMFHCAPVSIDYCEAQILRKHYEGNVTLVTYDLDFSRSGASFQAVDAAKWHVNCEVAWLPPQWWHSLFWLPGLPPIALRFGAMISAASTCNPHPDNQLIPPCVHQRHGPGYFFSECDAAPPTPRAGGHWRVYTSRFTPGNRP